MYYTSKLLPQYDVRDGLIADWPMNEGSGTTINNKIAGGQVGTLNGSGGWISENGFNRPVFNGVNSTISIGNYLSWPPMANFTLNMWFKSSGYGPGMTYAGLISLYYSFRLCLYSNSCWFSYYNTTAVYAYLSLMNSAYHNVSMVYGGTNVLLYIDSVLVASAARSYNARQSLNSYIGHDVNNPNVSKFMGRIGDVRIYDRALNQPEIALISSLNKYKY